MDGFLKLIFLILVGWVVNNVKLGMSYICMRYAEPANYDLIIIIFLR